MEQKVVVRNGMDRLRYVILFELLLVAGLVPLGAVVFQQPMHNIGLLAAVLSLKAMLVSLLYNWAFDQIDARAGRVSSQRSLLGRIIHAVGLEVWLVLTSMPIVIWWLGVTIPQAILMDLTVSTIVMVYTFIYSWGYDRLFPLPLAAAA